MRRSAAIDRNAWLKIALPTVVAVLALILIVPLLNSLIKTPTDKPSVQKKAEEGCGMIDLGTLGGSMSAAFDINDNDLVVGYSLTEGDSALHACVFHDGAVTDLGTLGGTASRAWAINSAGQIVGESSLAHGTGRHAFLYTDGEMKDLGTLGGTSSLARDINDLGHVVGESQIAGDMEMHAFLFTNGEMKDLGTLGGTMSTACGINNRGGSSATPLLRTDEPITRSSSVTAS